jgi:hypothetical protein
MTPLQAELEHLCRIATRQPTDTDHSHKEWKTLVWRKANALAESSPADFADLPAALLKRMQSDSNGSGPNPPSITNPRRSE